MMTNIVRHEPKSNPAASLSDMLDVDRCDAEPEAYHLAHGPIETVSGDVFDCVACYRPADGRAFIMVFLLMPEGWHMTLGAKYIGKGELPEEHRNMLKVISDEVGVEVNQR